MNYCNTACCNTVLPFSKTDFANEAVSSIFWLQILPCPFPDKFGHFPASSQTECVGHSSIVHDNPTIGKPVFHFLIKFHGTPLVCLSVIEYQLGQVFLDG